MDTSKLSAFVAAVEAGSLSRARSGNVARWVA